MVNQLGSSINRDYSKIFKAFCENYLAPCALLDVDFYFVKVNKEFAEIFDLHNLEFSGKSHFEIFQADTSEIFDQVVKSKKPYRALAWPIVTYNSNGQQVITYWDWTLTPILNEDREVEILLLSLFDVTQRIRNGQMLDGFFNLSVDLLSIIDFNGKLVKINSYFENNLGYSQDEISNKLLFDLIHKDDKLKMERAFNKAIVSGEPIVNLENRCLRKDGSINFIQWAIVPDPLNRICYVVGHDVTESKKIQAELNRLETLSLLGTITAEINHELRNPMTTIRGFLQLLLEKDDCQKYRNYFELMLGELDRAYAILTEYLSLAKVSNTKLEKRNINEIIQKVLSLIKADPKNTNVKFETFLQLTPEILADENSLTQLIINLVKNGIEAMNQQGVIRISTYTEGGEVILAVKDQGPGIDPEVLDKLGTPFLTTKENGVGLGLPICYRIVKSHNAKMDVETGSSGTTFFVRFNQA